LIARRLGAYAAQTQRIGYRRNRTHAHRERRAHATQQQAGPPDLLLPHAAHTRTHSAAHAHALTIHHHLHHLLHHGGVPFHHASACGLGRVAWIRRGQYKGRTSPADALLSRSCARGYLGGGRRICRPPHVAGSIQIKGETTCTAPGPPARRKAGCSR